MGLSQKRRRTFDVARQIRFIHNEADFNIRNWISNSKMVAGDMNHKSINPLAQVNMNVSDEIQFEKVLRMYQITVEDELMFKVSTLRVISDIIAKEKNMQKNEK